MVGGEWRTVGKRDVICATPSSNHTYQYPLYDWTRSWIWFEFGEAHADDNNEKRIIVYSDDGDSTGWSLEIQQT